MKMSENTASAAAKDGEIVVAGKSGNGTKKQKQVTDPSLNMDELRDLANLVIEHGFTDFEFENENIRVRLSKMTGVTVQQAVAPAPAVNVAPPASEPTAAPAPVAAAPPAETRTQDFSSDHFADRGNILPFIRARTKSLTSAKVAMSRRRRPSV